MNWLIARILRETKEQLPAQKDLKVSMMGSMQQLWKVLLVVEEDIVADEAEEIEQVELKMNAKGLNNFNCLALYNLGF